MNPMNNAAVAYVHHDHNRLNGNPGIAVEVRVQLVSVGAPLGIVMRLQSDDVLARGGCGRRCEEPVKKDYVLKVVMVVPIEDPGPERHRHGSESPLDIRSNVLGGFDILEAST